MKKGDLLLVTDMQKVYTKGGKWECLNTEGAAENILKIISIKKDDVIFTRFIADPAAERVWADYNKKYADVNEDSWSNEMMDEFAPALKKYPLYTKSVYSSLAVPQVLEACRKAERVVISGVIAECCVLSTVFALIDQGIYTIYLTDAVSGLDQPKEDGTVLMLKGLSPLHLKIMTTEEYLSEEK